MTPCPLDYRKILPAAQMIQHIMTTEMTIKRKCTAWVTHLHTDNWSGAPWRMIDVTINIKRRPTCQLCRWHRCHVTMFVTNCHGNVAFWQHQIQMSTLKKRTQTHNSRLITTFHTNLVIPLICIFIFFLKSSVTDCYHMQLGNCLFAKCHPS